jgi:FkbM family methyltransferase
MKKQLPLEEIQSIHNLWMKGALTKHEFIEAMHMYHQILFQYAKHLHGNIIQSLSISEQGVEVLTRDGVKFDCDPDDVYSIPLGAFTFGEFERLAGDWLMKFMPDQGAFFDIGANVGWYSLHLAQKYPQALICAFEPIPDTYKRLAANIALNGLSNIKAFNVALAEQESLLTFHFRPDMTGAASARNITESENVLEFSCPARRLDDCWREIGQNPDLLKCDVEGAELFVFRGGRDCLAEARPVIFCEMLRKWSARFNYTPNDIIRFLSDLGYLCFEPAPHALKAFERMTEETLETNFFFLHRDKHSELINRHAAR